MFRLLKFLVVTVVLLVVLVAVAITFTIGWRPIIGPSVRSLTDESFEATPARLQRGDYLVNGVAGCFFCHSERDPSLPGAPPRQDRLGAGLKFEEAPMPGEVYASNITPDPETGVGNWTDDMLARAIREGIGGDGRALFPLMPYQNVRNFSDEDLASIVVYLRSIPPVKNALPATRIDFPVNRLIMSAPQPINEPVVEPEYATPAARGERLITLASCADCHTPADESGTKLPNMDFSGGNVLRTPEGKMVATLNLTADASGIPYYDETIFLNTIRTGQIGARKIDMGMPWVGYKNMSDDDLKAIFAYLKTVKPVVHHVDNVTAPTMCPLCGQTHGLGDRNQP